MSRPANPCPDCGSVLFWKSNGAFRCAKHDPPADPIGEQFYVTKAALKALQTTERPTKPCPLCGGQIFWRSNSSGMWNCAEHHFPMDQEDLAEAVNVRTGELVTAEVATTKKGATVKDAERIVKAIAKRTGRTQSEVKQAIAQVVAEMKGGELATKAAEEPGLNLAPVSESQHTAVRAVKNMTGGQRKKLPSTGRDLFGRQLKDDQTHSPSRRGMFGERRNT